MDPPKINYIINNSIMVINNRGSMRQLFVPFRAQVVQDAPTLIKKTWVVVEEVRQHDKFLLIYRIANTWWPYYVFRLSVEF
jgi:hypothetical protein